MGQYLEFKPSSCKNCYRCLRECPVKAIKVVDQKAVIMEELCILCLPSERQVRARRAGGGQASAQKK